MRLASSWIVIDLRDDHFAHDLVARNLDAGRAPRLTLALAAQRGERALALLVVEQLVDRQLAALATLVGDLDRRAGRTFEIAALLLAVIVIRRLVGDRTSLRNLAIRRPPRFARLAGLVASRRRTCLGGRAGAAGGWRA